MTETEGDSPKKRAAIRCPHCGAFIEGRELAARRKYRNKYGIDVFSCPGCEASIKIDPHEYMFASVQIARGEYDEGTAVGAVPEHELLPSERAAKRAGRPGCLPVVAAIGIGIGVLLYVVTAGN